MSELYKQDDLLSWEDWQRNHPVDFAVFPPYKNDQHRDNVLRYRAEYLNKIMLNGGFVGHESTLGNPYTLVWNGAAQRYMSRAEALAYGPGSGGGIVAGPSVPAQVSAPISHAAGNAPPAGATLPSSWQTSTSTPVPAPRASLWARILKWFRRLFG